MVSVIGLGYVGLCTSVCLASRGFRTLGVDVNEKRLAFIRRGKLPFHENGLEPLLKFAIRKGLLTCAPDYADALRSSNLTFIAVGTPSRPSGEMDLSYLESAAEDIGEALGRKRAYHVVVVKSTTVPGTTEGVVKQILERASGKKCGKDFGLCSNPEFLREGSAVKDTIKPDAVVVGGIDARSTKAVVGLWKAFYRRKVPTVVTTPANAELIKLSVNSFRGTQLSFLNTVANICANVPGADIDEVGKGLTTVMSLDKRYRRAGLGFGGSCLPKDLKALLAFADSKGVNSSLLRSALEVNDLQPERAIEMARELVGSLKGKKVTLLGLAYKPNTDDVRDSVAITLAKRLKEEGANLRVYDPEAMPNARAVLDGVEYAESARRGLEGAECCIVATEWQEFRELRPKDFKSLMANPAVVDGRRIYDPAEFSGNGLRYLRIGSST